MTSGTKLWSAATGMLIPLVSMLFSPLVYAEDQHWVQRINMSGVVEAEYGSAESFDGTKSSDIAVATVEVNIDAKVTDKVNAYITLLHEEDATDFSVDAAYIDVDLGVVNVQAGAMGAPFGAFASHMLSDPLTLQIAETAESMLQVSKEMGPIHAAVYVFNGSTQEEGADDVADQMGVHLAYVTEGEGSSMDIGIDHINNIADSDAIGDYLENNPAGPASNIVKAYVPAQIIHVNLSFGSFHFIAEHLMADKFDAAEISFKGKGAEITATNLELAYDFSLAGMASTIGVAAQSTAEAVALGMPESKTLVSLSMEIFKFTALSFEYTSSSDYALTDGGTGKDANSFTAQLAVGF